MLKSLGDPSREDGCEIRRPTGDGDHRRAPPLPRGYASSAGKQVVKPRGIRAHPVASGDVEACAFESCPQSLSGEILAHRAC